MYAAGRIVISSAYFVSYLSLFNLFIISIYSQYVGEYQFSVIAFGIWIHFS